MGQLVLGVLLASTMLAITAALRPYRHAHDNLLAIVCQAAVVGSLALGILLNSDRERSAMRMLTFESLGKADLFEHEQAAQLWREEVIGHALIAVAVVPLVAALCTTANQPCPAAAASPSCGQPSGEGRRGRPPPLHSPRGSTLRGGAAGLG